MDAGLWHYFFLHIDVNIKLYFYHLILHYVVTYYPKVRKADFLSTLVENPEV